MDLQHINIKINVDGDLPIDPARFIEVFHRWVGDQMMDELLIDVADYRHVPHGPGVIAVGHEADYGLDNRAGRYGLLYNRKASLKGSNQDRFRQALAAAAKACGMLETEFDSTGPLKFARDGFELIVNDRAMAPNTAETFAACQPELEAFLADVLGHHDFSLKHNNDSRSRFSVTVTSTKPIDFQSIQ